MSMYLSFYGLERSPFGPTADPDFLYLTHGHREALAQLTYAIQERKGFMLLTAEVGTGKTTLLEALRRRLDGNTAVAYVSNSMLPFAGILEYMLEDFEIVKPGESHAQRLVTLQNFLVERHRAGLYLVRRHSAAAQEPGAPDQGLCQDRPGSPRPPARPGRKEGLALR